MVLKAAESEAVISEGRLPVRASVCVFWIDWYAYHVARFRALCESRLLEGRSAAWNWSAALAFTGA